MSEADAQAPVVVEKPVKMVKGMSPKSVRAVAEGIVQPDDPVRNAKVQFKSVADAERFSDEVFVGAGEKGINLPRPLKSGADKLVDHGYRQVEAQRQAREIERPEIEAKRTETAAFEARTGEDISEEDTQENARKKKEVEDWDAAEPEHFLESLSDEQRKEYDRLTLVRDKISQNERYQRKLLAEAMLAAEESLLDPEVGLEGKATALREMQRLYSVVGELTDVVLELGKQQSDLLLGSGVLFADETDMLNTLTESDKQNVQILRNRHPIRSNEAGKYGVELNGLNENQRRERSTSTKNKADELLEALKKVVGKEVTPEQEKAYMQAWGLREVNVGGESLFDVESESVLETVLVVEARKADAEAALSLNLEAIESENNGHYNAETAFEAANLLVQAEAAEVITHAMILETVNKVDAQNAIKVAESLGALDTVNKLRLGIEQGKENIKHWTEVVGTKMGEWWDVIKDPTKKVTKAVLMSVLVAFALAILTTSAAASALGGGR